MATTLFQQRFHRLLEDRSLWQVIDAAFPKKDDVSFQYEFETRELQLTIDTKEIEMRLVISPRNDDADTVSAMVAFKSRGEFQTMWYKDMARRVDNGYANNTCFTYFDVAENDSEESWGVLAALEIILKGVVSLREAFDDFKAATRTTYLGLGNANIPLHLSRLIYNMAYSDQALGIQYYFERNARFVARRLF